MYHELSKVHCANHHVTISDLLRAAYMHKYGKDLPVNSLRADVVKYESDGTNPPYLDDFLIDVYGVS